MDVDERTSQRVGESGELKIRGQAEAERRKGKWDEGPRAGGDVSRPNAYIDVDDVD
jgi:hypothetical protein